MSSKRAKNGYFWAIEQHETWDNIADEKNSQLDEILNSHLDWFDNHKTVSNLLSWKKPHYNLRKNTVEHTKKSESNSVKNDIDKEDNNHSQDQQTTDPGIRTDLPTNNDQEVDQEPVDLANDDDSISDGDRVDTRADADDTGQEKTIDNDPMEISSDEDENDALTISFINDRLKVVIESPSRTIETKKTEYKEDKTDADEDEDADTDDNSEIRSDESVISVGKENSKTEQEESTKDSKVELNTTQSKPSIIKSKTNTTKNSKSNKPIVNVTPERSTELEDMDYDEHEDEIQLVVSKRKSIDTELKPSVSKQTATSPIKPPSTPFQPPTRQQSSFMSRLFRLGRPSIGKTSTLSKEDSPSAMSVITTKRPQPSPEAGNRLKSISNMPGDQQDIQVSDLVPERPFKHPRLMHKKKEDPAPPKDEKDTRKEEEEEEFIIPPWARDPELESALIRQSTLDPDKIFGSLPAYRSKDIFPPSSK